MSLKSDNPVNAGHPKRIVLVLVNPSTSSTTGWPVGFWWSELSHPYAAFIDRGYEVEVFSYDGGACEADALRDPSGYSSSDLISMGFIAIPALAALLQTTRAAADIDVGRFDAIVVAGGQAPMFTMENAGSLQRKFVEFMRPERLLRRCAMAPRYCAMRVCSPARCSWREKLSPILQTAKKIFPIGQCGA